METRQRAKRSNGPALWAGSLVLAALIVALPGPVVGEVSPPRPPPPSAWTVELDLKLEIEVRQALNEDKVLRPLNVGVKVRKGCVTLWGPVSSALDERRAMEKVEQVRGLAGLRSELYVRNAPPNRDALALALLPEPVPTRTEVALPNRESGALTLLHKRSAEPSPPPPRPREEGPGEGLPPIVRTADTTPPAPPPLAVADLPKPGKPPVLLAPVALGPRPSAARSLAVLVEQTRQSQARFRLVQADVQGSVVLLRSGEARPEDVTALATALLRVSGVGDVVIDD